MRPKFLVTLDTEGDDLWACPRAVTTANAAHLPRFQSLSEKYGLKPTYLTDHEMALCPVFREFGRDVLARRQGEIGMHLHAWDTPPLIPLTSDDYRHQPYLIEYPETLIREKVSIMTHLLEETFDQKMTSHRAGRWAFNEIYAKALADQGYQVDSSVTPGVDWRAYLGAPGGAGGADYRGFPHHCYYLDLNDIKREGNSQLLEVPVTIRPVAGPGALLHKAVARGPRRAQSLVNLLYPPRAWLRPDGRNLASMLRIQDDAIRRGADHLNLMIHTSELMPGGSPGFPTQRHIDSLYGDLEQVFAHAQTSFDGATLTDFANTFRASRSTTSAFPRPK